jgi:hypothetical protein
MRICIFHSTDERHSVPLLSVDASQLTTTLSTTLMVTLKLLQEICARACGIWRRRSVVAHCVVVGVNVVACVPFPNKTGS